MSHESQNGYIGPAEKPSSPVEWTLLNRGRPTVVNVTKATLFEADVTGFDSFGVSVSSPNIATLDTLTVEVSTPSGAVVDTYTITGSAGSPFAAISAVALPVIWPRYVVTAVVTSSDTAADTTVDAVMFVRRTSRDA